MSAPTFEYAAVTADGRRERGVTTGASRADAYRIIAARGLTPVRIEPVGGARRRGGAGRRASIKDISHVTHQFGALIAAGITISESLRAIADQEPPGPLRDMLLDIESGVQSGKSLADAMHAHRETLGDAYVETVRAAQRSGTLAPVLEHLSEMLERSIESSREARGALLYPACVVGVLVLACVFLIGFVIPRFADMFARRGADLPWMTEALMLVGLSFQNHWAAYLAVSVGGWFAASRLFSGSSGRIRLEGIIGRVPYVREVFTGIGVARFTRVLGIGVASGLSLIESLELAGKASGRSLLGAEAHRLSAKIRSGSSLAAAMQSSESLPAFALRMLAAGERAGDIPSMCSVVSRHFEREAADRTKNLSTVLEPFLVVSIAGVVLMLALAIFLPMWDSVKLVG